MNRSFRTITKIGIFFQPGEGKDLYEVWFRTPVARDGPVSLALARWLENFFVEMTQWNEREDLLKVIDMLYERSANPDYNHPPEEAT